MNGALDKLIVEAFHDLLGLPFVGNVTEKIWQALDLTQSLGPVMLILKDKAALTITDRQLHSSSTWLDQPPIGVTVMTWPRPRTEVRHQARENFVKAAGLMSQFRQIDGVLQFDLFLPADGPVELRMAWLPVAQPLDRLAAPLRSALFPWGGGDATPPAVKSGPTGADLIELASAAWTLHDAMRERLRLWPDAAKPPLSSLDDIYDRFKDIVPRFNHAARRLALDHAMPVSRFDETWSPHNLRNALRFSSLAATLKADLARIWGNDARGAFARMWDLFAAAPNGKPGQESLAPFENIALNRQTAQTGPRPQGHDIFISYAWPDKTRGVRDLYEFLRTFHPFVWIDEEERPGDQQLNQDISAAMLRARCILICLSREMLTRGGYALREVLLALSHVPDRCLLVRLDRMPVPPTLRTLQTIAWFEPDATERLQAAVLAFLETTPGTEPTELTFGGPIIDRLVHAFDNTEPLPRRIIHPRKRRREIALRAALLDLAHDAVTMTEAEKFNDLSALHGSVRDLLRWSALTGPAARRDPTVFLPALRARCGLIRAHVQTSWARRLHARATFRLLEEIMDADPDLLRPAPGFGFNSRNCRLALQDCLDTFDFAEEVFRVRGRPDVLASLAGYNSEQMFALIHRMRARAEMITERMFALRAVDELSDHLKAVPSWPDIWSTTRDELNEIRSGSHPVTIAFLQELKKVLSHGKSSEIAVALSDGAIDSFPAGNSREELWFDLPDFRLRCVARCYAGPASKHEALASVRGTVFEDLLGTGSEKADLNLLCSLFLGASKSDNFPYCLYRNILPSQDANALDRLPPVLRNPFLVGEMLSPDELSRATGGGYRPIYDEFD